MRRINTRVYLCCNHILRSGHPPDGSFDDKRKAPFRGLFAFAVVVIVHLLVVRQILNHAPQFLNLLAQFGVLFA